MRLFSLIAFFLLGFSLSQAQHEWQKPKPLIPKADLEKIVGPLTEREPSKEINIVWVWGYDKHHRPGAHDYLRVRDRKGKLREPPKN